MQEGRGAGSDGGRRGGGGTRKRKCESKSEGEGGKHCGAALRRKGGGDGVSGDCYRTQYLKISENLSPDLTHLCSKLASNQQPRRRLQKCG